MLDYKKLIKDNQGDFNEPEELEEFIYNYIDKDKTLDELEDNISEQVDGLLPIYYHNIIKEWTDNPEAHEKTIEVSGEYASENTIYEMMTSDLYFYYFEILEADFCKLKELADAEDDE